MTALDDALNSSSIVFGNHPIQVNWREWGISDYLTNVNSVSNFADHYAGSMTVSHSLDDALPDPVTMTTQSEASGSLSMAVNGREGLSLWQSGFRSFVNANSSVGSWNSDPATKNLVAPIPNNAVQGDSLLAAVLVDSSTANIYQNIPDPSNQWALLGSVTDGTYRLLLYFKRRWNASASFLVLASDVAVNFMAHTLVFWGLSPASAMIDMKAVQPTFTPEAGTGVTAHNITAVQPVKGYTVTFWGQASATGNMTTTGVTKFAGPAANTVQITSGISALREPGSYTSTGTNGAGDSSVPMASVTLQAYERPRMDARQYFSPFNVDSPVYGFERDTAGVLASIRTLTATGPVDTQIFAGQMQGIPVQGRQATLNAVSKTRISMNRSVALPVVSGYREGLTLDWLVTWLASRGSQFVGPAPNRYTRFWAPAHGSLHPHLSSDNPYSTGVQFIPPGPPGGPFGYKNPVSVPGPFLTGMFAQQTATITKRVRIKTANSRFGNEPDDAFPHITEAGGPFKFDVFSKSNSRGRICFWIRGDALTTPISYSTEDIVCQIFVTCGDPAAPASRAAIVMGIDGPNRRPYIQMGSNTGGTALVSYGASGLLPTDDAWHFFGFWWDFAAGTARVIHNSTVSSSSFWLTSGFNITDDLPVTDGKDGTFVNVDGLFHLPVAEFMYDAGWPDPGTATTPWQDQYPAPTAPGRNMTMRSTGQALSAVAVPTAVNAWDTLADLAKASLSAYRINESDNLEFLPLSYFGETAQMTPSAVQDTKTNAQDLDITVDPSKLRNSVTVQFQDTRINTNPQPIMNLGAIVQVPPGTSVGVFPFDLPVVEIHGAIAPDGPDYQIANLTSTQISTAAFPVLRHFITANASQDGGGTVLGETLVEANILAADALSITIQFLNRTGATAYLTNNGDQIPFMRILGYGVSIADGYSTISDAQSISLRGERSLETELPWIQDRATAEEIASLMSSMLARPRPELALTVSGNPLRKPGQLVTVNDSEGTAASGTWRVLGVEHQVAGAQYTQALSAVQVLPVAVWDGPDGWDIGVWGP